MTTRFWLSAVSVTALAFGLSGCGSGVGTGGKSVAADSQACIDCHETQHGISKITGENIVTEWKSSRHAHMNAASCNDCHETTPLHGGSDTCANCHGGGAAKPVTVSDANGKCFKCHGLGNPADIMVSNAPQHFGNVSSINLFRNPNPASYVSSQYVGRCRACHNPHDPTTSMAYNKAWAAGGMGDLNSGTRGVSTGATGRDFKQFGTPVPANQAYIYGAPTEANYLAGSRLSPGCVRCHTTTGFINFVSTGFMDLRSFGNPTRDWTKEATNCDACHSDYNFKKQRSIGPVTLYFNFSSTRGSIKISNIPTVFADYGKSNICIPCHAGRGEGNVIKMLDSAGLDFSNNGSPSGHDFSGAGTIAGSSGYEFPSRQYVSVALATDIPNPHESINVTGNNPKGPCVTCHMSTVVPADSHKFLPLEHGIASGKFDTYTGVWRNAGLAALLRLPVDSVTSNRCSTYACHAGTGTSAVTVASLNDDKFGYMSALSALSMWLLEAKADYKVATPGNNNNNVTNPNVSQNFTIVDWLFFPGNSGPDTMGASFNRGLLINEPGGYTHRPLYVRRLLFDSIAHLAQGHYPAKDATAVKSALLDITTGATSTAGATRRLPAEVTTAARNWLFGRYTSALTATSTFKVRRPGDLP